MVEMSDGAGAPLVIGVQVCKEEGVSLCCMK
jgi:hypothetical protein